MSQLPAMHAPRCPEACKLEPTAAESNNYFSTALPQSSLRKPCKKKRTVHFPSLPLDKAPIFGRWKRRADSHTHTQPHNPISLLQASKLIAKGCKSSIITRFESFSTQLWEGVRWPISEFRSHGKRGGNKKAAQGSQGVSPESLRE